ncbi:MarR family transcriptional regulator [Thiomicrorhabdus sp.]|uniref:MarR family winged helix-turn-helix transcriptional regulator n=1 Tax=Thiomicrorhabdus sp. TaxID=2039724 RepID=UPI0029C97E0D|nr:MarR family transcriptional regulator [Thiomicrorhabdus sp.]
MFDSTERENFGFQFSTLSRLWRRMLEQQLVLHGISDVSWVVLVHLLRGGDDCSQKELAARVGMDASTLVRLVDALEQRGHLVRKPNMQDRRSRLLRLTDSGIEEAERLAKLLQKIEFEMLAQVSDQELAQITEAMEKVRLSLKSLAAGRHGKEARS